MLKDPWLVAAWPGMASVGAVAVRHLVRSLDGRCVLELDPVPWFDVSRIQVKDGILRGGRGPRTAFHALIAPPPCAHDVVAVVADAQPPVRVRAFADTVLAAAEAFGVSRVVTFAAMAAPVEPSSPSRVFAAATSPALLSDAVAHGAIPLEGGEVSGMNGALIASAACRGLDGVCLLGEFPFFAGSVPNPKAASAVLGVFARLSGATLDVSELDEEGRTVDRELSEFLARLSREAREAPAAEGASVGPEEGEAAAASRAEERGTTETHRLTKEDVERIERLFAETDGDRAKALALKAELDRLGVFGEYKDRFLDLFRKGE